jgi:hypothetical protein
MQLRILPFDISIMLGTSPIPPLQMEAYQFIRIPVILMIRTVLYLVEFVRRDVFPQGAFWVLGLVDARTSLLSAMYSLKFLIPLNLRDVCSFLQDDLIRSRKKIFMQS